MNFTLEGLPDYLFRLQLPVRLLLDLLNIHFSLPDDVPVSGLALAGHWRSETIGPDFTAI